jgi:uncharacterized protein
LLEAIPPLVLSPFVLAEADYLIQKYSGVEAELLLLEDIVRGAYEVAAFGQEDVAKAREVVAKYRKLGIGLADASMVVLADRHSCPDVLTLDHRHFRVLRPWPRKTFRILPEDG